MHALTCTVAAVLRDAPGGFPYSPAQLGPALTLELSAGADTREVWAAVRAALPYAPPYEAVDVRRLPGSFPAPAPLPAVAPLLRVRPGQQVLLPPGGPDGAAHSPVVRLRLSSGQQLVYREAPPTPHRRHVVLAVTCNGEPLLQLSTGADGCPDSFGRHPTATVRVCVFPRPPSHRGDAT